MLVKCLAAASLALSVSGCIGDPLAALDRPEPEATVERAEWEPAPAGCEGVDAKSLRLAVCEGEPLLGALVDWRGDVRCVDSFSLLTLELGPSESIDPVAGDPSPQPNHPRPPELVP
jgi:hypothetical protein